MIKKSMVGILMVSLVAALLLITTSCQKKVEVTPGPSTDATTTTVKPDDEQAKLDQQKAEQEAALKEQERIRLEQERAAQAAQEALAAMTSEKIYFDYDSSELKSEAQATLTKKADWLKANSSYKLKIEGHCDNRGSTEYNLALGGRRAEAASKFISALGVSADRITTISYGEEKPAVEGDNEAAWSKNRRDEFILIQ
jgi:peptidoglycan-associated lipoprotein